MLYRGAVWFGTFQNGTVKLFTNFKMATVAMETEKGGKIKSAQNWMKFYRKDV